MGNDSAVAVAAAEPTGGEAGQQPATRDIVQRWGRVLGTAVGIAALAGAGQLGVGYGLGLVWFAREFPDDGWWSVQLTWVAWFAALAVLAGGMGGAWAADRAGVVLTLSTRAGLAGAAGLGAAVVIPLTALPAESATVVGSTAPATATAVAAALGGFVGIVTTTVAMVVRLVAVSLVPLVAVVWTLGLVSGLAWLASDGSLPLVRLAVLDLPAFSTNRSTVAILCVPLVALLICGAIAGLARSRQLPPLPTAMSSTAAPGLLAFVYLIGSPSTADRAIQTSAYAASLIAVAVGLLVALLVGVARMPTRRPGPAAGAAVGPAPDAPLSPAPGGASVTPPVGAESPIAPRSPIAPSDTGPRDSGPSDAGHGDSGADAGLGDSGLTDAGTRGPGRSGAGLPDGLFSTRPAPRVEPPDWARPPASVELESPGADASDQGPEPSSPGAPAAEPPDAPAKPWSVSDAWPITLPRTSSRSYSTPFTSDSTGKEAEPPLAAAPPAVPQPLTPPPVAPRPETPPPVAPRPETPPPGAPLSARPSADPDPAADASADAAASPPGKKKSWRKKMPRLARRSKPDPDQVPAGGSEPVEGELGRSTGAPLSQVNLDDDAQPGLQPLDKGLAGLETPEWNPSDLRRSHQGGGGGDAAARDLAGLLGAKPDTAGPDTVERDPVERDTAGRAGRAGPEREVVGEDSEAPDQDSPESASPAGEADPSPTSPAGKADPSPTQPKPSRRDEEEHLDWISSLAGKADEDLPEPGRRRLRRNRDLGFPESDQGEPGDF